MIVADRLRPIDYCTFPSGGADGRLLTTRQLLMGRMASQPKAADAQNNVTGRVLQIYAARQ
ncbi:MAG: hypothetical protein AAF802_11045 [Planctomycetota bacterium]